MTRCFWDITTGMYSCLERCQRLYPDIRLYSRRFEGIFLLGMPPDQQPLRYQSDQEVTLLLNSRFCFFDRLDLEMGTCLVDKEGHLLALRAAQVSADNIEAFISQDQKTLAKSFTIQSTDNGFFLQELPDLFRYRERIIEADSRMCAAQPDLISPAQGVFISKTAVIGQYVHINPEKGPVIVDAGAQISPFSSIDGPAYIGHHTRVDNALIRSHTVIRDHCRLGGEIEATTMESYSNKHHEGFVGHSYLGSWVNIGAMSTTSDLKNNYGSIRLHVGEKEYDTGLIKLGSVISDYSRIGIGMMLNTGTVIGPGANLFQQYAPLPAYIPPFQWGLQDHYRIDRFIEDLRVIVKRRGLELTPDWEAFLRGVEADSAPPPVQNKKRKSK